MDDESLINEVLELTLAHELGKPTEEERARLERLFTDNPRAIALYLRLVEDTLALREVTAGRLPGISSDNQDESDSSSVRPAAGWSRVARSGLFGMLAAASLLFLAVAGWWWSSEASPLASDEQSSEGSIQVVNVSNVRWSDGSEAHDEWSLLQPGDVLKFDAGLLSLFLANGVDLRIEGPAELEFVSPNKILAYEGKLAARVGPRAAGFCIKTPHANVIDRGTSFGLSVTKSDRTAVVVYEGIVDLDVVGDTTQPRRRLATGEAVSVDRDSRVSRITTVQSSDFLEPVQATVPEPSHQQIIRTVSDNVQSMETAKYYRIVHGGFREDCRAYVDRLHEWNGLDERGLPPFLMGGDYVMMFNDDKIAMELEVAVVLNQPAELYVLFDDRIPPPEWLTRDFVDTRWDVGTDDGRPDRVVDTAIGPGESVDHVFSVWRRTVSEPDTIMLGAPNTAKPTTRLDSLWSMYGIIATPLRSVPVEPANSEL